ncbi:MAG: protein translocase subunit SecD [bacterium]|nr:protein translocase subunit SecD [bacterium]
MNKTLGWKIGLILLVIAFSIVMFYPPGEKINLGLDLKGGMHLVFEVQTDKAVEMQTNTSVLRLKNLLKQMSITFEQVKRRDTNKIDIIGIQYDEKKNIGDIFDDEFKQWEPRFSASTATLVLKELAERDMKDQTVNQALETIRNRIDEFGVAEPVLQREKDNRLLIELPGVSDKEKSRVMSLIESTAMLEFKEVVAGPFESVEAALKEHNGALPEDLVILKRIKRSAGEGYSILKAESVLTGRELKNAQRSNDEFGAPAVSFTLNGSGASKMQKFSAAHIGQRMAIVLDNRVVSDPTINGVLSYSSIITGVGSLDEATDLALILRSGALPAPLKPIHEQVIGPSLGADSVRKGIIACSIGLILVMLFMVIYYKGAGINSIFALILNIVILMGVLAYFKATLTVPGIAGIILTIGMAVDANVLIFERIKEDLAAGKSPKSAIDSGFKKAFVTIFDANLTTIIAAIFLFQFGTSTIKGFSVTLMIGIVASMFTAVFVSRVIFDLTYGSRKKLKKISI